MKKLGIYIGILSGLVGATASANEKTVQVHCTLSTRVIAGNFHTEIKAAEGFLSYAFEKYHATIPSQNYQLNGHNQEGFGTSALSWSSISVAAQAGGQTKITALGLYYNRATLVGKTEVEIVLKKTGSAALGGFSLVSFKVNGVQHSLEGPNHCQFE